MIDQQCQAVREWIVAQQAMYPQIRELSLSFNSFFNPAYAVCLSGWLQPNDIYILGQGATADEALKHLTRQIRPL